MFTVAVTHYHAVTDPNTIQTLYHATTWSWSIFGPFLSQYFYLLNLIYIRCSPCSKNIPNEVAALLNTISRGQSGINNILTLRIPCDTHPHRRLGERKRRRWHPSEDMVPPSVVRTEIFTTDSKHVRHGYVMLAWFCPHDDCSTRRLFVVSLCHLCSETNCIRG